MCELRADWWSPGGGAESPEGDGPYGSPPGPYFSMKKSRQKSLGECPETPDASVHPARKAKSRLPGAGLDDTYKVPQAHFYVGTADRVPLPRIGEGGRGKGQMLPQATFGAHLCAVRICFSRLLREKQYSYPAQLSVKGVCQGGIRPP